MRVPPPGFENALRPSSALRALSAPPSSGIRSVTACGSSTAVYIPGSIACGLRLATAFCAATRPSAAGIDRRPSRASRRSPTRCRCRPASAPSPTDRRRWCGDTRTARCCWRPQWRWRWRRGSRPRKWFPPASRRSTAASTTRLTAVARVSGFRSAVRSTKASTVCVGLRPELGHEFRDLRATAAPGAPRDPPSASTTPRPARWSRPTPGAARP